MRADSQQAVYSRHPNSVFCSRSGMSFRMKNTNADPSMVSAKGIVIQIITGFIPSIVLCCLINKFLADSGIPINGYFVDGF